LYAKVREIDIRERKPVLSEKGEETQLPRGWGKRIISQKEDELALPGKGKRRLAFQGKNARPLSRAKEKEKKGRDVAPAKDVQCRA